MNRLKELRLENNYYQADIAKILNITQSAYSKIELGQRDLVEETIIILANFYNVSTDYLLGLSNIRRPIKRHNDPNTLDEFIAKNTAIKIDIKKERLK